MAASSPGNIVARLHAHYQGQQVVGGKGSWQWFGTSRQEPGSCCRMYGADIPETFAGEEAASRCNLGITVDGETLTSQSVSRVHCLFQMVILLSVVTVTST